MKMNIEERDSVHSLWYQMAATSPFPIGLNKTVQMIYSKAKKNLENKTDVDGNIDIDEIELIRKTTIKAMSLRTGLFALYACVGFRTFKLTQTSCQFYQVKDTLMKVVDLYSKYFF